jgi:hypothetical protein
MRVSILGVGMLCAGLEGWANSRAMLGGILPYTPSSIPDPEARLLQANERRRSSDSVRWAIEVAQEAIAESGLDPREVATVFASSGGEMGVLDKLCRALATSERIISPTVFHQSVHNTAAGYWGIATSCQQSSTALSCYDDSCAAGLLEAVTYATVEGRPVLFVAYDLPAPEPLSGARPIASAFAAALVLTSSSHPALATVALSLAGPDTYQATTMPSDDLERIRLDNPAARLLPLLRALAVKGRHTIHMGVLDEQQLVVEVES